MTFAMPFTGMKKMFSENKESILMIEYCKEVRN